MPMNRSIRGLRGALMLLPLIALTACQRESNDNLRDSYERMMASAERRAVAAEPAPAPAEPPPVDTMPAMPATLPIDTLPAPAAPPPPPPPPPADTAAQRPFEGTAGVEERESRGGAASTLRAVRTAMHDDFDRIVFEFEGAVPGYNLEFVDRPARECGSGRTVQVAGQGWLRVRLDPARATVIEPNRSVQMPVLRQLTLTCDSGNRVEWVVGLRAPNQYRVLELREPSRLVVDVMH
jgi:hypothetical protein